MNMFDDPIVRETRKTRERMAAQHNYDVYSLGRHYMEKQQQARRVFIHVPGRTERPQPATQP